MEASIINKSVKTLYQRSDIIKYTKDSSKENTLSKVMNMIQSYNVSYYINKGNNNE